MTAQHEAMPELFKMFINFDGFGKCSSVYRILRIPAFESPGRWNIVYEILTPHDLARYDIFSYFIPV